MPISVYIGMGVTAIAVIALILSISLGGKKNRSHRDADLTDDFSGGSYESQTQIVDFPEDDEESDDTVSSKTEIKSFIGTWYKQDAAASQKAVLTVTMQYEDSFEFRLEIWNGKESAVINATAFYSDETTAEYAPKKKAKLTLQYDTDHVSITHTGKNSAFGIGDDYVIDGQFTEQEPDYPEESTEVTYDYDIYRSDKVVQALKDTLSSDDYALYQDMMKNGLNSPINYERTLDKNGRQVNVDSELNAVKYYAHLSSTGTDMIFICSEDAKIYLLFYNSEEIIYCTNDKSYSSKMPASFQAVAKAKNIKPTFR